MSPKELIDKYAPLIARHEVEIALAQLLGLTRMDLHSKVIDHALITEQIQSDLAKIVERRATGEPLQYILENAPFRYLNLKVGPGVLIPRPETEGLVDLVLHEISNRPEPVSVIDAGAGSGAIVISIAYETLGKKEVKAIAVEKSEIAARYLMENITEYGFDIRVVNEDIGSALPNVKCDVLVANPPYIPASLATDLPTELKFEPAEALYAGVEGLDGIRTFVEAANRLLKPGGFFAMEHFEDQGEQIESLLTENFNSITLHKDLAGRIRYTTAYKKKD